MRLGKSFRKIGLCLISVCFIGGVANAGSQVGQRVMPRMGCRVVRDGKEVKVEDILLPLTIIAQIDDSLLTDEGTVDVDDVVSLDEATEYYTHVIEATPEEASAFRYRAITRGIRSQYALAVKDIKSALAIEPKNCCYLKNYGDILRFKGDFAGSVVQYERAIENSPEYVPAYINCGIVFDLQHNFQRAVRMFEKAVELAPTKHVAWAKLGAARSSDGRRDRGIRELSKAIELGVSAEYLRSRAHLLLHCCKYEDSLLDVDASIKLNPAIGRVQSLRGYLLLLLGRKDDALQQLNETINRKLTDSGAHRVRSLVWSSLGEDDRQLADLKEAVLLSPEDVTCNTDLALFLATHSNSMLRDGAAAVKYAKRACVHSGWNRSAPLSALAAAKAEMGEFEEAEKLQKRALKTVDDESAAVLSQRLALIRRIGEEIVAKNESTTQWKDELSACTAGCELSKWSDPERIDRLSVLSAEMGDENNAVILQHKRHGVVMSTIRAAMKGHLELYSNEQSQRCDNGNYLWMINGGLGVAAEKAISPIND